MQNPDFLDTMNNLVRFNVIVAACENGGIGFKGGMPWTLKGDLRQFARLTTETKNPNKRNAVVMGRKTWFAIPEKFRPLKNRINMVITQTMTEIAPGVYQATSIEDALSQLSAAPLRDEIETVWIIGGQSLYTHAIESPNLHRVYFTNILQKFECDAFFPVNALEKLQPYEDPSLPSEVQTENGISYKFQVFESLK